MRRSKIVCTLGPATETVEMITALVEAGMNVARINCSHGTTEQHDQLLANVRAASQTCGKPVAVLADLQGPKIRLADFANNAVEIFNGQKFTITVRDILGDEKICGTTYKGLPGDCKVGDPILIDDGNVALRITAVDETDVHTVVEVGGVISNHKGINLPGVAVSVPALSEKDKEDLRWALRAGADFIALSFVRNAADARDVHDIMREEKCFIPVIAKIEKPQAVDNLSEIIKAFDGIMVARGDLGVEMPLEEVPLVQKKAIAMARRRAKPVIVATQVLDSMIKNPRPTRAEASDCANAILDGADAVMLSGETSMGAYPVETVRTMSQICETTELNALDRIPAVGDIPVSRAGVVSKAAVSIGQTLGVDYLVVFTQSGMTARRVSRLRTPIRIIAVTPIAEIARRMALFWGVEPQMFPAFEHSDEMVAQVDAKLRERYNVEDGDQIVIVAGMPPATPGSTNLLRLHTIGESVVM